MGRRIDGNVGASSLCRQPPDRAHCMVRPEPDPATPHGGNSWRPLGPLFPIQKGGQQLVCPLLGLAPFTGKRLTRKGYHSPRGVLEDLFLALCHLPLMPFDLRLRTSPLVVASDASATGLAVCRTSSLEPKGLLALAALQEGHNFRGEEIGLIEVGTTPGGVRRIWAYVRTDRNPVDEPSQNNEEKHGTAASSAESSHALPLRFWPKDSQSFRTQFRELCADARLPPLPWRPYSLRRGGETAHFLQFGSLDKTVVRGRWQSTRTARLYVDEGIAALASIVSTPVQERHIRSLAVSVCTDAFSVIAWSLTQSQSELRRSGVSEALRQPQSSPWILYFCPDFCVVDNKEFVKTGILLRRTAGRATRPQVLFRPQVPLCSLICLLSGFTWSLR